MISSYVGENAVWTPDAFRELDVSWFLKELWQNVVVLLRLESPLLPRRLWNWKKKKSESTENARDGVGFQGWLCYCESVERYRKSDFLKELPETLIRACPPLPSPLLKWKN
jgi:hypothetical protein